MSRPDSVRVIGRTGGRPRGTPDGLDPARARTRGPAPAYPGHHRRDRGRPRRRRRAERGLHAAVAAALGTGPGSRYRYLASRDDLLDLMSDAVVRELRPYPEADDDWLGSMLVMGRRQLALHRRHPWLLDLAPRPTGVGPESLAWFDVRLRILEPVAGSVPAKFEVIALMTGVVTVVAAGSQRLQPESSQYRFRRESLWCRHQVVANMQNGVPVQAGQACEWRVAIDTVTRADWAACCYVPAPAGGIVIG